MTVSDSRTEHFSCWSFELVEKVIPISDSNISSYSFAIMKITFCFKHDVHNQGGNDWSSESTEKKYIPFCEVNAIF